MREGSGDNLISRKFTQKKKLKVKQYHILLSSLFNDSCGSNGAAGLRDAKRKLRASKTFDHVVSMWACTMERGTVMKLWRGTYRRQKHLTTLFRCGLAPWERRIATP